LNRESWLYLLRFGGGLAAFFSLTRWEAFIEGVREPYCTLLATTIHHAFDWVGIETRLSGSMLIPLNAAGGIQVVPECDGLVLLALFGAGVLAVPFARTARPWLLALAGVAILVVINWFRLVVLAITSFYYPIVFDSMHHYFMQGILMLAVLALYVAWLRALELPDEAPPPDEPAPPVDDDSSAEPTPPVDDDSSAEPA
jgi:exosortase/archaeosortase family protein